MEPAVPQVAAVAEAIHGASCEWNLADCVAEHVHDRAATAALEAAQPYLVAQLAGRIRSLLTSGPIGRASLERYVRADLIRAVLDEFAPETPGEPSE